MVSKSFLQVGCGCGARSSTIRKDVDDNRGWQRNWTALNCPHFHVKYDAYTKDGGLLWWGDDKIRFEIHGTCKMCDCKLSRASSQATGCSNPDHDGTIKCSQCKSTVGWSVRHCAHGLLKTIGWTATAGVLGAVTGGLAAPLIAAEASFTAGAVVVGGKSALVTLVDNIQTKGDAGMCVSAHSDDIKRMQKSMDIPKPRISNRYQESIMPKRASRKTKESRKEKQHGIPMPPALVKSMGFTSEDWDLFRNEIAKIESGGKYDIAGGSGGHYDGRYQLGAAAKTDGARLARLPDPGHDPASRESFRKNPPLQEKLFAGFTKANHTYLMRFPEYKNANRQRKLEILAYAHNQGMGGAAKWMKTGKVGADGFGTKGTKYSEAIAAACRKNERD